MYSGKMTPSTRQQILEAQEAVETAHTAARAAVEHRAAALRAAHTAGATWAELGGLLGVSGARAQHLSLDAAKRAAYRRPKNSR